MKLATYSDQSGPRVGLIEGDDLFPLPATLSMRQIIDNGVDQLHRLAKHARNRDPLALSSVQLLAPLTPASVRDFVAFEEHVEGVRRSIDGTAGVPEAWYDAPTFYFTNPHAIYGPDDEIPFPERCQARDFELEVAVIISRDGRSIGVDQAADHVFGYTIMNDWSARDVQSREMKVGLGPAKGKDFASSFGPWIVTADELESFRDADGFLDLWCSVSVNGVEVGRDLLSNMGWTFETMISYASRDSIVRAGDLLGSGTTGHGGCLAELWGRNGRQDPPPLQSGDVVTVTVEGIGTLTNTVASAPAGPPLPAPRRRDAAAARTAHAR